MRLIDPRFGGGGWLSAGSILLSFLYGVVGIALGVLALRQLKRTRGKRTGDPLLRKRARKLRIRSIIGLTLSALTLLYYIIALFQGTHFG